MGKRNSHLWRQVRGKFRRFRLAHTRRGREYIRRMEARRGGECLRCGACCRLAHRCAFLRMDGGLAVCSIHDHRPANCRVFPIDPADLADRDVVACDRPCGFSFPESETQDDV